MNHYFLTGKYRDGDEDKISPGPHYVARDFSDAVDYIIQNIDTSITCGLATD